ncbi:MAG: isoleucine--tRNA ligase [Candidatus Omnitrophica bacterium]|nr:isoleucine--tRNA ligase [Candidatus Omnitrophota bacterium]
MDYKDTLNLPKTSFPMKANLPNREPETLKSWEEGRLYQNILGARKGSKKFILHDGPPYANGDIHMGHALNKILKDIIVKFKTMEGYLTPYVPGWDCHGLPVEHQLFQELGITKYDIDKATFREKAGNYAKKFVQIQKEEFKRLAIFGDWEKPYLTLDKDYEADIIEVFRKLVKKGYVYRGLKPVNWCMKCETALAEAEVEYEDHKSPSIFVKFKLQDDDLSKAKGLFTLEKTGGKDKGSWDAVKDMHFVIWTTTPWTLISNVAIALHPNLEYVLIRTKEGGYYLMARDLVTTVMAETKEYEIFARAKGSELKGLRCRHPFFDRDSIVVLADYVSNVDGSGCVHTAPGHGAEDFSTGLKYSLPVIMPVDEKGRFDETTGEFAKLDVFSANKKVLDTLTGKDALIYASTITHSYPHCWRCKAPVITRATKQWFVNVDHKGLRSECLKLIKKVKWIPDIGERRISSMVENRPDWCLSRQRYWGVPIPVFYCKGCGEALLDPKLIGHIRDLVRENGSNIWFKKEANELLPKGTRCPGCGKGDFKKEEDILDVWFDSGVSHQAVLMAREGLAYPADMYLEGSDQHRGWFQSALLTSVPIGEGTPYKSVLTHGFVTDGDGKKMSKSRGNVVSPLDAMKKYGADILRLWVASCDYRGDVRVSDKILAQVGDTYRKIRNTFKFFLGNLHDFDPDKDGVAPSKMLEIDRWALNEAVELFRKVTELYRSYEFHRIYRLLYEFCTVTLSNFYLDILKDRLYTFGAKSHERLSAQSALAEMLKLLVTMTAPILSFTAEEAWTQFYPDKGSVHMSLWPKALPKVKMDEKAKENWQGLLKIRNLALKGLELKRGEGVIGNSLQASLSIFCTDDKAYKLLKSYESDLTAIFIVSEVVVEKAKEAPDGLFSMEEQPGIYIKVDKSKGTKCNRCWNYSTSVGSFDKYPDVCSRCFGVLSNN